MTIDDEKEIEMEKPPLGIKPKKLWLEELAAYDLMMRQERIIGLVEAIERRSKGVTNEWAKELLFLIKTTCIKTN